MDQRLSNKFILYLNGMAGASFDSMEDAEDAVAKIFPKLKGKGYSIEIKRERCDDETVKKIQESLKSYLSDILDEVATVPSVGTTRTTPGGTTANVANATPATSATVTSAPKTQQEIDAMAQILKNAGLNQSQLNQIIAKAR